CIFTRGNSPALGRSHDLRIHDSLSLAAVDFSVHHSALSAAVKYKARRVNSANLWPYGHRGMGMAGAHLPRVDPPDEAIRLAAAGARIGNISPADCSGA